MTFSENVKNELVKKECQWDCCAKAELAAALLLSGGVAFRGRGKYGLTLSTENGSVYRYYFGLIKRYFGVSCEIRTLKTSRLGERVRYLLTFPEDSVEKIMSELELTDENALFGVRQTPVKAIYERTCCQAAFLKSAFLISGSLSSPEKEYSLGIAAGNEEMAACVADAMQLLNLNARVSPRKAQFVAYLKSAEDISEYLIHAGAHSAVLSLENTRIYKELRNQVNRAANCDSNNIERTVKSAQNQIEDIELVDRHIGLEKLPPPVREIAQLRLMEPNASLAELGEMCSPPIGKSGVNNRLRRITEMAKSLRGEN
ncbi:MAG: DNA-binding protein WhiA [Clostridia bacterium]|nr:DNA-binding protein WhiA [Clostridia bacterium]